MQRFTRHSRQFFATGSMLHTISRAKAVALFWVLLAVVREWSWTRCCGAAPRAKLCACAGGGAAAADLFTSASRSYMKQHTHKRTRSHRQRTHRGASGIGSSLACGAIKYDMRLAGAVTSPTVSQYAASAAVSLCLALLGASPAPPHRRLERLAAAAAASASLWRRACLLTSAAW
eukprot:scaffold89885_cov66-Phaeocystis_antarctica.AAC.5